MTGHRLVVALMFCMLRLEDQFHPFSRTGLQPSYQFSKASALGLHGFAVAVPCCPEVPAVRQALVAGSAHVLTDLGTF